MSNRIVTCGCRNSDILGFLKLSTIDDYTREITFYSQYLYIVFAWTEERIKCSSKNKETLVNVELGDSESFYGML